MREKQIEQKLTEEVRKSGGLALKFISPGRNGMPDRLVLMPEGRMAFVELKAPGQKPRKLQLRWHARLRTLGFPVYVLDDPEEIPALVEKIRGGSNGGSTED